MPKLRSIPIEAILNAFRATGNLDQACYLNKISPNTLLNRRKRDSQLDALIRAALYAPQSKR